MGCIENVNYAILVNGQPSPFFKAERGLRQGCPLSPLLFILAIDAMSLHINPAVALKEIIPIRICKNIKMSHNLFVEDVLIFAMLSMATWLCIKSILDRFHKASGLAMNKAKTILYHNGVDEHLICRIAQIFDIQYKPLSDGIKYLGFRLKGRSYKSTDWRWLVDRFLNKLALWSFRTLSLGGRVVLVKSVLSQLLVFWGHLFLLPGCIIQAIN